ncbi:ATP-dependent RNA helicase HrpB [Corynebacterium freiburgense]|nr:ATP-dependent RNA helicase HrpB [Corynebacterium freiburgense]
MQAVPELSMAIQEHHAAIVQAPPGTGKTTLVPPLLHNLTAGKILVTAPRRVAVRAAARRLSKLSQTPLGSLVGYAIRGEYVPGSAIEFLTPGVLLRRLLQDPELPDIAGVIIDEVHERHIESDLVLGMVAELRQLREDLTVVAMSATLNASTFADFLSAPIVRTPAVTFPLDITYVPGPERLTSSTTFLDHIVSQALGHSDSVLVFVPGLREVEYVCKQIGGLAIPLHGRQTPAEQDRAFESAHRIVVATNIAESSVTVPGVRVVIDAGLSRVPRRDTSRNITGLVTESCTRSQADQRAGRAGREGPGQVIRCYSKRDYQHFKPDITPEIQTSDLTEAALFIACWGPMELIDAPPPTALKAARETLTRIGALHQESITPLGRRLAQMPADPRLARALIDAAPLTGSRAAAKAVSILAHGDTRDSKRFEKLIDYFPDTRHNASALVTAYAFPDRIAKYNNGEYILASGTRAQTTEYNDPWLAISEIQRIGQKVVIRQAFPITEQVALSILPITEQLDISLDAKGQPLGKNIRFAGAIELSKTPATLSPEDQWEAIAQGIINGAITLPKPQQEIQARLQYLHTHLGSPWPAVTQVELNNRISEWLNPDLTMNLENLIPWDLARDFHVLAPIKFQVPSGRNVPIMYTNDRAIVQVKLQECFGLNTTPQLAGKNIQFHLLSPANRPIAITDELERFWAGPYQNVRKEMRGRYPKHPWPENPFTAMPTAQTKQSKA